MQACLGHWPTAGDLAGHHGLARQHLRARSSGTSPPRHREASGRTFGGRWRLEPEHILAAAYCSWRYTSPGRAVGGALAILARSSNKLVWRRWKVDTGNN